MNTGNFPNNDESTFLINPGANHDSGDGSTRQQKIPVSNMDFNHMFSPIQLVKMFQDNYIENENPDGAQKSTSIAGLLWNKHDDGEQRNASGSVEGAGDTLRALMSNGSNPIDSRSRQQQRQEHQEHFMAIVEQESLITPSSPPDTTTSQGSVHEDTAAYSYSHHQGSQPGSLAGSLRRSSSVRTPVSQPLSVPAGSSLSHRRSVQYDGRHMPPIPSSPQLRPSSRLSLASYGSSNNAARSHAIQPPASARPSSSTGDHHYYQNHLQHQRYQMGRPATSRPVPMHGVVSAGTDFSSHPLQIHSAIGPSTKYQKQQQQQQQRQHQPPTQQLQPSLSQPQMPCDMSLRHEVLDKIARKSQPNTPYDANISAPSGSHRPPSSMGLRPVSSMGHPHSQPIYTSEDITVLPGDSRLRAFLSSQNLNNAGMSSSHDGGSQAHHIPQHHYQQYQQQQQQHQLKSSSSYTSGLNQRQDTASHFGSIRRAELAALSQVRKTSDSSAHLLTPNDFNGPLPKRVGNMVLDDEIGEWVEVSEYVQAQNRKNSPGSRGNNGHVGNSSGPLVESPLHSAYKGPASGRSSMSMHSHVSAFPEPLATNVGGRNSNSTIGMGLISPVENQRTVVREMAERKAARRNSTSQRRPIEDEALGSIVQRLMTPATSPDGCTALDLSGSGIRNLSGLAQLTSRLEAICLSGNKLRSLSGLPTGLVSLRAPSNWIRFSVGDVDKFSFARELPHLEEIDLSANEIGDISVFSGLRHLRILELNRNRIESLHGLRGCRRLLQLGLRDNIVTNFDLDAIEAPLLASLDLFNNRLRVITASIADFTHLSRVNMVKNDLEQVELHGAPAEAVRELRLSENPLLMRSNSGVVEVGNWQAKYPNLKTLYLDICNIRQLARPTNSRSSNVDVHSKSDMAASSWLSLFNLSLRGNALQPLLAIDFDCLSNLKNLYAPDTHMVLPRSLPIMNHLLQLVLCNAGLSQLPVNMGSALPQLKLLDVSNNPELNDPQPILQLAQSLEVLKCRTVGFGDGNVATPGIQTFPDVPNDNNSNSNGNSATYALESTGERNLLRTLSKMRRLRRLDLRFNQCNRDLYAPPPSLASQALQAGASSGSAVLSLDGALSPQMAGQGDGSAAASGAVSSARIDEDAWLRQDHAYVHSLKLTQQTELAQRREKYWISAISLFPRLEELDGIKVGPH
ncbi:hypothetical protein GGF40_001527 [Coemansia sp. RSA 1286]|nr:hypothetical protein IWW45_003822 [Coemansia sp. RSA 485]KAJ2601332.1 hypothetical protein GGF39_001319 [Coemansia sp. RSA 1721]KAJ2638617.1 hypothetical protein GGF40_001527 [Coemansia sp. RSA 1286]